MGTLRLLCILFVLWTALIPVSSVTMQMTPPPTATITVTVVTGADGTVDTPMMTFKTVDGTVLGGGILDQPGDLAPGATNTYSFSVPGSFCDVTQFELNKPIIGGSDDIWQIASLTVSVDGTPVWVNTAFDSPITASGARGGAWQATHAYRDRCGALAWTLVELRLITADDGTADNLEFEIGGSFADAPFVHVLDQPGDLLPFQTDDYIFIVPMEFCEMTSFALRKPALGPTDDVWHVSEFYLSIDGTEVFVDRAFSDFNPFTSARRMGGTWDGTEAYQERCTSLGTPPLMRDPVLDIDIDDLIVPVITLSPPTNLTGIIRALPTLTPQVSITIPLQPLQPTPQAIPNLVVPPLQMLATPTLAPVPQTQGQGPVTCPGFLPSRLVVGRAARVTPGTPNNLRAAPSLQSQLVGQIPGSGVFVVVGGPQCGENMAWWEVDYNGLRGWTAEGQGNAYWTEPVQSVG